jgi:putative transposase
VPLNFREILNGIFYVQRSGCQWEMMPHDLPPYSTVYSYFQKWQRKGLWQTMHDQVRQQLRTKLGRDEHSTVAIGDSQSVKTTEKRGRCTALTVARRLKAVSAIS